MIKETKQATTSKRILALLVAEKQGLRRPYLVYVERMGVLRVALRLIAYENGYCSEFSTSTTYLWDSSVTQK